ncbi:MAG: response regulator [Steroidobacteraceae bacterium]
MARILVVDDHAASRYGTVRILQAAGFDTIEAETGTEAISLATENIALIVLDVNLPDMDGFEVCRNLRSRVSTANLPITYLSATFTNTADMQYGLLAGADSYLTHPVEPLVLISTVRALLFAKEADRVRRHADARFKAVFQLTASGITIMDDHLRFTDVNTAFCELAGAERSALLGTRFDTLACGEFAPRLSEINTGLAKGGRWEGLVPIGRSDGERRQSEWRIVVESETGARIAVVNDVTERFRGEQEREHLLLSERTARAEADRSNQMKDEFLAMLSHELRNPLSAILGWASLLRRMPNLPPVVRQGVEAIERNSRVQSHLTADLLDFAGIQFGKMRLNMAVVDPSAVVDAAMEITAPQAKVKQIDLTLDRHQEPVSVLGDEARLQQVVWNLLTNAIKFTPAGGRVAVRTSVVDGCFELTVSDSGKGISAEFLPRLFDRFSQQESGTRKNFAGLGIGLSIVRHLVVAHSATIDAASAGEGQGATFRVRIPLTELPRQSAGEVHAASLEGLDILVVEDSEDARSLIVRLLFDAGAWVREADSGNAALAQIQSKKPDVLISDIGMAGKDGYELMRALRAAGYSPEALPAIALTAFVRTEERSAAMEAGYQVHLGKPVNGHALIAAVARLHAETPRG